MKFKVGDKAIIKDNTSYHGFKFGETIEIIKLFSEASSPHYECTNGARCWYAKDNDLEGIEETFTTQPIDYTGCHPDIAEALKRGESILCRVRDNETSDWIETPSYIIAFIPGYTYPYLVKEGDGYRFAEPIANPPKPKTITKVKKASEIVKWLEDNGYEVDKYGYWYLANNETFTSLMFQHCGKGPSAEFNWLPEWLEEVEC